MRSITRIFLANKIPDLQGARCVSQSRFYLYRKNGVVIRVQTKGDTFELERKVNKSAYIREGEKISITRDEFDVFSKSASDHVIRDNYLISKTPLVVLRIYHGRFEGLARVEIKFKSVDEAKSFVPLNWLGKEITLTPLAKDETLLGLTEREFQKLLSET